MKLHILKIKEEYFKEVLRGNKTFELRKNDRDYQVGDLIHFLSVNGENLIIGNPAYNEKLVFQITYILKDVAEYGLDKDYCILGIKKLDDIKAVEEALYEVQLNYQEVMAIAPDNSLTSPDKQ